MGEALTCCQEKDQSKENIEADALNQQKSDNLASDDQQRKDENTNQDNQNGKQKKQLKKVDLIQSDLKDTSDSELIQSFKKNWQDADLGTKSRKLVLLKFKESSALNEVHKTHKIKDALEDQSLRSSQLK